jgi:hypothetical protein
MVAEARPARGRLRRLEPAVRLWRVCRYPLLVVILSRLVVVALFAMEGWVTRPHGAGVGLPQMLRDLGAWDGIWYRSIAVHGYDPSIGHGDNAAFLPLYPMLLRGLREIAPFIDLVWLGAAFSTILMAVGMCLLYKLTDERFGRAIARRTVLFLSISPLAFVFSAVYAESLFLVLVAGAFLLAERRRFITASSLGARGVLTRPVGLALVPALMWMAWGERKGRWKRLLPIALLPAAEALFSAYLWWETGDPLAQTHAQARGWGRSLGLPPLVIWNAFTGPVLDRHELRFLVHIGFALVWTAMLFELWKRRDEVPIPYLLFAAGCVLMPFAAGSLVSAGRIGMLGFPLFWALAILGRREGIDTTVKVVSPALMAGLIFVTYGIRTFTP